MLLASEQFHQQAVVPAFAFDVPLVTSHDAHWPEADPFVAPDRGGVRRRRVDREAVMAALVDQVSHDESEGLRAEAAPVQGGIDEEIDACMAIPGLELLQNWIRPAIAPSTSMVRRVDSGSSHGKPSAGMSHQRTTSAVR
jgi:hypothetical protein